MSNLYIHLDFLKYNLVKSCRYFDMLRSSSNKLFEICLRANECKWAVFLNTTLTLTHKKYVSKE